MRMLITGSRDWTDSQMIHWEMAGFAGILTPVTVVHGACPTGADDLADKIAREVGWNVERHPADWRLYGRSAGPIRNALMVQAGADVCLAFIRNGSRGATMCADLAEKAGIPTHRFTAS